MKHSDSLANIAPALVNAQAEIKNSIQTADNPFYKSTYAPLDVVIDDVRPVLNKHGIAIMQDVASSGDDVIISTMLLHISGEWIQQEGMRLPMEKITPQGAGSAVTYGRRYTLPMMAGTATEKDDDGNAAEKDTKKKPTEEQKAVEKQKAEAIAKLNALPPDIVEGFKIIDVRGKGIWQFCNDREWDHAKIKADINRIAYERAK